MNTIWGVLKTMVYTSAVLSLLSLLHVWWTIRKTQFRATQKDYLCTYCFVLIVLFILMVFAWYVCMSTKNDYNKGRATYVLLSACILDPAWKAVPASLWASTSLDWFHNWMIWWVVATTLLFLFGVAVLLYVMSALGKLKAR